MTYFELLRVQQGYLERIAFAMLGNHSDAEDAMQETALAGYQHFDQLRGGEFAFRAWIRRILIRKCQQTIEKRKRIIPVDDLSAYVPTDLPGPDLEATHLWEMVSRLSDPLRVVVVMRYMLDMPQQEVADELGIPVGTVKSRLAKALLLLRDMESLERGVER